MNHITHRARAGALGLVAALALAACGSSATPAPSVAASTAPSSAAPASAAPTSAAPASAAPSQASGGGAIPSGLLNQAPDLEAKLPSTACGGPVIKESYAGDTSAAASANPMLGAFGALAGSGASVAFALAIPASTATCSESFFAYRIQGTNSTMLATVLAAMAAGGSQVSLGGKTVTKIPSGGESVYFYVNGDTLFGVSGATDAEAAQALSAMP